MGNYHQRTGSVAADILEGLHKACKTPQVDARLRFVEHGELRAACKHCSYLDPLSLAAGERRAHLAADVLLGAQTHLRQQTALLVRSELLACRKLQQVADGQSLEPYRLLECICNSQPCAPGDVKVGDVLAVEQYSAACGLLHSGDQLCKRGLSSAVRTRDNGQAAAKFTAYSIYN